MPRTPAENERIKKERKERILAAGLKVFAEHGLTAAKMSDIAKGAGVSYGLVYKYFPSKEDIFIELVGDAATISRGMIADIEGRNLPPLERIREIFIRLFRIHSEDPAGGLYFRMMLQLEFYPRLWEKLAIKDLTADPVFEMLQGAVVEGQRSGAIVDKNPQEILLLLGYLALSFSLGGHKKVDFSVDEENLADLIVRMISK